jgi:hypothetical protein
MSLTIATWHSHGWRTSTSCQVRLSPLGTAAARLPDLHHYSFQRRRGRVLAGPAMISGVFALIFGSLGIGPATTRIR